MKSSILLLFISILNGAVIQKRSAAVSEQCKKVPQQKLEQQCNLENLVVRTANLVEQCRDEYVTHCKERFAPVPLVPFRTSRIVGSTSLTINAEGTHYNKREDVHHGLSTGRTCKQVKEKQCVKVPEEKIVKTEVCKDISTTILVEQCEKVKEVENSADVETIEIEKPPVSDVVKKKDNIEKLPTVELQISPAVVQVVVPGNYYFIFFLPFLFFDFLHSQNFIKTGLI